MRPIKLCSDIINKEDINLLIDWLKEIPKLTKGDKTVLFEKSFSEYLGCKHSIYCNSGSSANLLIVSAMKQMGLLKNSKIVLPQVSWSTTVFPAIQFGLDPILCDCSIENLGLDITHLERIIEEDSPAAIMLVHVLGFDSSIEIISDLCKKHNILLIEDTCESLGSETSEKKLGTFGDCSSFSFYFGHHISTIEGGMVCTDNAELADVVRMIRSHGWDRDLNEESKQRYKSNYNVDDFSSLYKFYYTGFNLRSTDLQAFIGINQIPKMPNIVKKREINYHIYRHLIREDLWKPVLKNNQYGKGRVSNMGYPLIIKNRGDVYRALKQEHIECRPLVAGSMGLQPAWVRLYGENRMPNSDIIEEYGMYVPNHQDLTQEEISKVCDIVNKVAE
jgi:CDP-6-deoxy-D-xylo-4-hexulose-3-dehydrase